MSWRGMDEALDTLTVTDADIEQALETTAEAVAEDVQKAWPVDTGASRSAWRARGTVVENPRPETSHIRQGLASRLVPDIAEKHAKTLETALGRKMGAE